ncbi:phage major capsid protein [Roseovarius ramblicola]
MSLYRGRRLASVLDSAIDREVERRGDDATRGDVIEDMGSEAGISASTVSGILAGDINCPPEERLRGFARVLRAVDVTFAALEEAGNADGCSYGEGDRARAVTPDRINATGGGRAGLFRRSSVRQVDLEARTVELAFSSEEPVVRWFGEEVLVHDAGAMRTDRLDGGLPVLVNHDWDDQVGVTVSFEVGSDRVGRAVARFGRSARADEIFQDIVDGIRRSVSFGYIVHKVEIENRDGMPDLVRVTDYEPFEISIVAVPADITVGVGRDATPDPSGTPPGASAPQQRQTRSLDMRIIITRDADGNLVRAKVDDDGNIVEIVETLERAGEAEQAAARRGAEAAEQRARTITEMGEQYGAPDLARQAVRDRTSPEEFQRMLLDHLNSNRGGQALNESDNADIGMTPGEVREYSFLRALRALSDPTNRRAQEAAAFEFEASAAAAQRAGREPEGMLVPADVLRRAINTDTSGTAAGDTGGFSVATDLMSQSFIDMLRNRAILMQLATPLGGLVGNIAIPRQDSGSAGYWIGEDDTVPEDGFELGQIGANPKTVAARTKLTRRLLMQSSLDVELLTRRDLASALALTIDLAGFYGTGSNNQPTGIKNVNGINAVDFGTDGAGAGTGQLPTYAEVLEMEEKIATDNADVTSMSWALNPKMRGHFRGTEKFASSNGQPIWESNNQVIGYNTSVTSQIADGDLFFGNFADLIIAMWGGLELQVDPYSESSQARTVVRAMQDVDFLVRHPESFCYGADTTA